MRILLITLASSLLLGSGQVGIQSVIMTGPGSGAAPLNPCLVSGWPINEGTGQVLHDVSGNANTANFGFITPVWGSNAGFPGSSLSFTTSGGQNAQATSTSLTNFSGTTPFSLAAWISITSTAVNQIIISSLTNAGTDNGWELGVLNGGASSPFDFFLSNNASTNALKVHGSTNVINTGKHYVVATYDGSRTPAGVKLYVDGTLETMTTDQNTLTLTAAAATPAGLGVRPADQNGMIGILAAPAIYNCVLTPTQVSTYFARGVQVN